MKKNTSYPLSGDRHLMIEANLLRVALVRNRQLNSTLGSSTCKNVTAILRRHTTSESMFISTLAIRRLVGTFHVLVQINY